MKPLLLVLSLIISLACPKLGNAQVQVHGVLQDAVTQEPIPFANIFFQSNQGRGMMSNQYGEFLITLYERDRGDQLVVSQLGYEPYRLSLRQLPQDTLRIHMKPSFYALQEVTVISDRGLRGMVKKALQSIPRNYGTKKYLLEGFYREYSISDSAYAEVIEAFVNIQDGAYKKPKKKSKIFWEAMRRSDDQRNLPKRLQGADYNSLYNLHERSNPVRERFFHFAKPGIEGMMEDFYFSNRGEYLEKGDTLVRIGFIPKWFDRFSDQLKEEVGYGELLINKSDFAILKVSRGSAKRGIFSQAIYQKQGQKYFLSSMQHAWGFRYENKTRYYRMARLLQIYRVHPIASQAKKKKGKRLPRVKQFRDIKYAYDPGIWEDNPFIVALSAQEALEADLSRVKKIEEQFHQNAQKNKRVEQ